MGHRSLGIPPCQLYSVLETAPFFKAAPKLSWVVETDLRGRGAGYGGGRDVEGRYYTEWIARQAEIKERMDMRRLRIFGGK